MKAKRISQRSPIPAKPNRTGIKKSPSTARRRVSRAEKDPDAAVLIDPCYLVAHHGMSRKVAAKVAKGALDICSKRWKQAEVRLSNDEINEASSFIHIGHASKVARHDIDMEGWNDRGAALKPEIHDYLLIRACEEAGVRPPTFERPATLDPMDKLLACWKAAKANEEYHQLATKAAWHAALLAGLRNFDHIAMAMSVSKVRRSKFKKVLSASLEKFMASIPKMESNGKRMVNDLGIETGSVIASDGDDMAEIAVRAYTAVAFSDSVESFARAYVAALCLV